jgi:hypothetical protein
MGISITSKQSMITVKKELGAKICLWFLETLPLENKTRSESTMIHFSILQLLLVSSWDPSHLSHSQYVSRTDFPLGENGTRYPSCDLCDPRKISLNTRYHYPYIPHIISLSRPNYLATVQSVPHSRPVAGHCRWEAPR